VENKIDRYCLITGAAGGIGHALAKSFSDAGYIVIATDISPRPPALQCAYFVRADLSMLVEDTSYANDIFSQVRMCLNGKRLNALINNAAIQILGSVGSIALKSWHQTLNVNLIAPFLFSQEFIVELEAGRGCVVNMSSIHAQQTKTNFVVYATSKAALSGLTRAMAVDLSGRVRVVGIEPAAIETEMLRAGFISDQNGYQQLSAAHPLGRVGRPDEVAKLALVLADGGMDFLNGTCVSIDGGISARLVDPVG
jgi:NAD(P)-dependent dehydrogenase (short-subunit alcohol dehydrogenase family)